MSWRRSLSLRGRKSMCFLLGWVAGDGLLRFRSAQFREDQVHRSVKSWFARIDRAQRSSLLNNILRFPSIKQDFQAAFRLRQRQRQHEHLALPPAQYLEACLRLLPCEAVECFGMLFQRVPNRM